MQAPNIFGHTSYIDFLKKMIHFNENTYGYKAKLAEAAGCQRSFISQVLSGQTHLGLEHAMGLVNFWELSLTEKDYFINLVAMARAANKTLKNYFSEKLELAQKDQENLARRFTDKVELPDTQAAIFYSTWQYLAITIGLTIKKYRTIKALAQRLGVGEEVIEKSLNELSQLGMVTKSGQEWSVTNSTIHLPKDSKFNSLNHSHWRNRAIQDSLLSDSKSIHYTSVCSVSQEDAENLRRLMFKFIDDGRKVIGPSKEEELFCLTCDWFKV
jgi:uncharacterized protein (TIGR02147 family)